MRRALLVALCACIISPAVCALQSQPSTVTGKVVDAGGKPVVSANVRFYRYAGESGQQSLHLEKETLTNERGEFALNLPAPAVDGDASGHIVASKEGLALGWAWVDSARPREFTITLVSPAQLAGTVTDETGIPVPGATVYACLSRLDGDDDWTIRGSGDFKSMVAATDAKGAFAFLGVPADATADFVVQAPGKARLFTSDWRRPGAAYQFAAGRKDIKIALPPEAVIEGKVVNKESGAGVPGIRIIATQKDQPFIASAYAISGTSGDFRIDALSQGEYEVSLVPTYKGLAEWCGVGVTVATRKGEISSGVELPVEKGAVLQVKVKDSGTGKPLPGAYVSVADESGKWSSGFTDQDGLCRVRLVPGNHSLSGIYKQAYHPRAGSAALTLRTGETRTLDFALEAVPWITGVALDAGGAPVAAATVSAISGGVSQPVQTDSQGKFRVAFTPFESGGDPSRSQKPYVFARHIERNLAGAVPVADFLRPLEVKMAPAASVRGRVLTPDGKPIRGARVAAFFERQMSSARLMDARTDADGRYECKALPVGLTYRILIGSQGAGSGEFPLDLSRAAAQAVQLKDAVLAAADKSVSGVAVDSEGKPLPGVDVSLEGEGQPDVHPRTTDSTGKFQFTGLVDGTVKIRLYDRRANLLGSVTAKAGEQDLSAVLKPRAASSAAASDVASLVGKPLPDLKALSSDPAWTQDADAAKDKFVLVLFYDSGEPASRNALARLSDRAAALKGKNIAVFAVEVSGETSPAGPAKGAKRVLPTARLSGKIDETKASWCVRATPWMILTDKAHVVKSDGFTVRELDAKLAEAGAN